MGMSQNISRAGFEIAKSASGRVAPILISWGKPPGPVLLISAQFDGFSKSLESDNRGYMTCGDFEKIHL